MVTRMELFKQGRGVVDSRRTRTATANVRRGVVTWGTVSRSKVVTSLRGALVDVGKTLVLGVQPLPIAPHLLFDGLLVPKLVGARELQRGEHRLGGV